VNVEITKVPIIDLHCDLLHYLATVPEAKPDNSSDIGCSIPRLKAGHVRLQVMAVSSITKTPNMTLSHSQAVWFKRLLEEYSDVFTLISNVDDAENILLTENTGIIAAIESAAALCDNDESLDMAFNRLEMIIEAMGKPLYISLTHHGETRFGGGNQTDIGIKADGRSLLDYLDNKKTAVDLSHTSDALAHDIIDYIDKKGLNIPLIASHSNYRSIFRHPRNLPDELAREIINREGLIGVNFLRAFLHPDDPTYLNRHVMYGLKLGGEKAICFGADYFCTSTHIDKTREPFYFDQHSHAGKYPDILMSLKSDMNDDQIDAFAHKNVIRFLRKLR
jgi:membrane dipeptidase